MQIILKIYLITLGAVGERTEQWRKLPERGSSSTDDEGSFHLERKLHPSITDVDASISYAYGSLEAPLSIFSELCFKVVNFELLLCFPAFI